MHSRRGTLLEAFGRHWCWWWQALPHESLPLLFPAVKLSSLTLGMTFMAERVLWAYRGTLACVAALRSREGRSNQALTVNYCQSGNTRVTGNSTMWINGNAQSEIAVPWQDSHALCSKPNKDLSGRRGWNLDSRFVIRCLKCREKSLFSGSRSEGIWSARRNEISLSSPPRNTTAELISFL